LKAFGQIYQNSETFAYLRLVLNNGYTDYTGAIERRNARVIIHDSYALSD
jgi:hypothetical protein